MFYERLKLLCDNKGIKLTNLIQELGMSSGNMNKWKKGGVPKGSTLSKLADYFNVSVDYLIGKTEEQTFIMWTISMTWTTVILYKATIVALFLLKP